MAIILYADTGADIDLKDQEKYNVKLLPIAITDGTTDFYGHENLPIQEMYDNMRNEIVYRTSQITAQQYIEAFKKEVEAGNTVICLTLSSGISGTYNSALLAKENILEKYKDSQIYIIDTKLGSGGYKLAVMRAKKIIQKHDDIEHILALIQESVDKVTSLFYVDDMQYLFRGGRVTKAQLILTGLFNIRVILGLNKLDGKIVPFDKTRGANAAIRKVIELAGKKSQGNFLKEQTVLIGHADNKEGAKKLSQRLKEAYGANTIIIDDVLGVIGAHIGPGAVTLFFLDETMSEEGLNCV